MKGTGAKRNVCPGSCVSTGAKLPVAPVELAPMYNIRLPRTHHCCRVTCLVYTCVQYVQYGP